MINVMDEAKRAERKTRVRGTDCERKRRGEGSEGERRADTHSAGSGRDAENYHY